MTGIHSSDASSPVPPQPTHLKNSDQLGVHQGRSPCVTGHNMMSVLHPLGQLVIHPPPSCVIGGLLYCCCINLNACGCVSLRNFAVMSAPRSWLHQQHSQHTGWETKDSLQPSATGHIYSLTNCGGGATTAQTVSPLSSHTESRSSILDVVHTASVLRLGAVDQPSVPPVQQAARRGTRCALPLSRSLARKHNAHTHPFLPYGQFFHAACCQRAFPSDFLKGQ